MEKLLGMIRKTLGSMCFSVAGISSGYPSWWFIYEPEKPNLLKNKEYKSKNQQ